METANKDNCSEKRDDPRIEYSGHIFFSTKDAFYEGDLKALAWDPIVVPGNWTLQGYDKPIYTNVKMPIPTAPPFSITAMVIHKLDEQHVLHLEDRVCDYIPEFGHDTKRWITIRHVLAHRSGIPNLPPKYPRRLKARMVPRGTAVLNIPIARPNSLP